jgi:hypothetical protein
VGAGRKAWLGFGNVADNNLSISNEIPGAHIVLGANGGNIGIGTGGPEKNLHIQGRGSAPFISDGNDRPGLAITGDYPELNLFSGASNESHGPTIRLGAYDNNSRQPFKHWVIGTSGRNARFLDIGCSNNNANPHAGIRGWAGRTVLTLREDGNAGIGIVEPQTKLHVHGGRLRVSESDGEKNNAVIELDNGTRRNFIFTDANPGHLHLRTESAQHHVLLQTGGAQGNVGIGNSNPGKNLHIQGRSSAPFISDGNDRPGLAITGDYPELDLFSGTNNGMHGPTLRLGSYNDDTKQAYKQWVIGTAGRNANFLDIGFSNNNPNPHAGIRAWEGRTVLSLLENGNAGVGTGDPKARLSVVANGAKEIDGTAQSTTFRISAGSLSPVEGGELSLASIGFMSGGNNVSLGIRAHRSTARANASWETAAIGLSIDVDNTERVNSTILCLHPAGRIGIGTIHPSSMLDVQGDIFALGRVISRNSMNTSSIEYKQDVETLPLRRALTALPQLRPVTFRFKDEPDQQEIGFIAEEVPEGVASSDRKSISVTAIVSILTLVIQHQQHELALLKERLDVIG